MKKEQIIKKFSEELKIAIVEEIESGMYSQYEASSHYGVSRVCLRKWLAQYGKLKVHRTIVEVKMANSKDEIRELKEALADSQLKIKFLEKVLEVAGRHYKTDIKKTIGAQVSMSSTEKKPFPLKGSAK